MPCVGYGIGDDSPPSTDDLLNGNIGEVIIFDEQLTAGNLRAMNAALQKKWFNPACSNGIDDDGDGDIDLDDAGCADASGPAEYTPQPVPMQSVARHVGKNDPETSRVIRALLLLIGICVCLGTIVSAASAQNTESGALCGGDDAQQTEVALKAEIFSVHYDHECGLLSLKVSLKNTTAEPLHLVAFDFAFVRGHSGAGCHLSFHETDRALVIDLAHTTPTPDGYDYFRSEEGSFGYMPDTIEFPAGYHRYVTYVFQLPVTLNPNVSETARFSEPQGWRVVSLRFGYGRG